MEADNSVVSAPAQRERIPPFVKKLVDMMAHSAALKWSQHGTCLEISDSAMLCSVTLPHYFRHHKLPSFTRQASDHFPWHIRRKLPATEFSRPT